MLINIYIIYMEIDCVLLILGDWLRLLILVRSKNAVDRKDISGRFIKL